ncbi:MAG TPA: hypothetical protein VF198_02100 [Vicinamibacterales bacterium]
MDPGVRSPLIDFFRRGEVARDVRLIAAQGALAPRALEQLALLLILKDDPDPDVARAAQNTIERLPRASLEAFLQRSDVPTEMREYFAASGVVPSGAPREGDEPLLETVEDGEPADAPETAADSEEAAVKHVSMLGVMEKMKLAMRGTREQRAVLIRDPNRMVAAAVLSSPKLTETEVESFARMANVAEDVLRVIGANRNWTKNYAVVAGLVRNPKTPLAVSMNFLHRINDRDIKMLAIDRNVPEPLRIAARKRLASHRAS